MAESSNTPGSNAVPATETSQSEGFGGGVASNEIVVDGRPIGDDVPLVHAGTPAHESVHDEPSANNAGGVFRGVEPERLQLAELLQGERDGNLDALLTFTSDGTNTTVHIAAGVDLVMQEHEIVLQGVGDLTAGGARSASVIIGDLLIQGAFGDHPV